MLGLKLKWNDDAHELADSISYILSVYIHLEPAENIVVCTIEQKKKWAGFLTAFIEFDFGVINLPAGWIGEPGP